MRQQGYSSYNSLSLEAKVRALKLLKVDGVEPCDILADLENTFGINITHSDWEDPKQFLQRVDEDLIKLFSQKGSHTQRLIKLLKQAQLISNGDEHEGV